jgi:hypothetical protein
MTDTIYATLSALPMIVVVAGGLFVLRPWLLDKEHDALTDEVLARRQDDRAW